MFTSSRSTCLCQDIHALRLISYATIALFLWRAPDSLAQSDSVYSNDSSPGLPPPGRSAPWLPAGPVAQPHAVVGASPGVAEWRHIHSPHSEQRGSGIPRKMYPHSRQWVSLPGVGPVPQKRVSTPYTAVGMAMAGINSNIAERQKAGRNPTFVVASIQGRTTSWMGMKTFSTFAPSRTAPAVIAHAALQNQFSFIATLLPAAGAVSTAAKVVPWPCPWLHYSDNVPTGEEAFGPIPRAAPCRCDVLAAISRSSHCLPYPIHRLARARAGRSGASRTLGWSALSGWRRAHPDCA